MENIVFKYTPQPWSIINGAVYYFIDGPDGHNMSYDGRHSICQLFGPDAPYNLALFTAAPLLLSALMKAVEDAEDMKDLTEHQFPEQGPYQYPEWYHEAKAAISKATNITKSESDDYPVLY